MSEAIQTATEPISQPKSFDLAISVFDYTFPMAWGNPEGRINVTHSLRRPTPKEETEYKRLSVFHSRLSGEGRVSEERSESNVAMAWLWDRIALTVSGYPGLPDQSEVTPEIAAKMRSTHKEIAIFSLLDDDAEVLPNESTVTFDGGQWAVRLRIGPEKHALAVLKLMLREWTEKERRAFEKNASMGSSEIQGKTQLKTSGVNAPAFTTLFDALFQSVDPDRESLITEVTVNGQSFADAGRDAFCAAFLGEWKIDVVAALVQLWRKKLSD